MAEVKAQAVAALTKCEQLEVENQRLAAELSSQRRNQAREIQMVQLNEKALRDKLIQSFHASGSWRVTAPLRAVVGKLRRRGGHPSVAPSAATQGLTSMAGALSHDASGAAQTTIDQKAATRIWLQTRLAAFLTSSGRLRLPSDPHPEVSIVLVLYNSAELTYACLASIAEASAGTDLRSEIILLDNGSTDATAELLDRLDGAKIVRSDQNLHFLRGANRAAKEAKGKYLLFMNNDALLQPGSLEAAVSACETDESVGAVGGRIILPDGRLQEAGSIVWNDGACIGYGRGELPDTSECMFSRDVDFCSGAFLLTPRQLFESFNGFDERYAPAYYEEVDYCVRLWQSGKRVVFEPRVVIIHYEFGSAVASSRALELQRRNLTIFQERHAHWLRSQADNDHENLLLARSASGSRGMSLLFIEDRVPHPHLGTGYPRSNELLRAMVDAGTQVTLFPMFRWDENWAGIRQSLPSSIEVMKGCSADDLSGFLAQRDGHYDAIFVCRPHNMRAFLRASAAAASSSQTKPYLIYDAEALFANREIVQMKLAGHGLSPAQVSLMIAEEVELTRPADLIVSVSQEEKDQFESQGAGAVLVIGHTVKPQPTPATFQQRRGFLFVGALHDDDSPNAESIRWFANEVWPHIQTALGVEARLDVVGFIRATSIMALESASIHLIGAVDDLAPWYEGARVAIVPTRIAAGIPLKAQTAAAYGVPMVATELIAQQLGWTSGEQLLATTDPRAFAQACIRLHSDPIAWEHIRTHALERVSIDCSHDRFRAAVNGLLERVPKPSQFREQHAGSGRTEQ
ncbi:glycosyltransferase [Variovorax sp. dw_308]|uniref:glycosyltransferase n=1 Tax=Variovorax sp. dw_308 TaxID=2721546 RepID=UPI001C45FB20|nr:glycosyltransferase [Variovorax sp. dw_308]